MITDVIPSVKFLNLIFMMSRINYFNLPSSRILALIFVAEIF
jgi:hypothetical protein